MSDLKHKTPAQLRSIIKWCENVTAKEEADRAAKLDMIAALQREVETHGRAIHNIGQKEVWARIWLARKETGQA